MKRDYLVVTICLLAVIALLPSCRTTQTTASGQGSSTTIQTPQANSGENVKLFLTDKDKPKTYKEIARVSSYKFNVLGIPKKEDEIYRILKEEAAKKGANAIINITEDIASIYGIAVVVGSPPSTATVPATTPIAQPPVKGNLQGGGTTQPTAMLVVISPAKVRSEPKGKSKVITTLKPGAQIENLGQMGDWFNIRLSNGLTGWVSKKVVVPRENS